VIGGQGAVAGDVVAEVIVGDRHDAVRVHVYRRLEGLVGERVTRRLIDFTGADQISPPPESGSKTAAKVLAPA
jgi:hypothetical protein